VQIMSFCRTLQPDQGCGCNTLHSLYRSLASMSSPFTGATVAVLDGQSQAVMLKLLYCLAFTTPAPPPPPPPPESRPMGLWWIPNDQG